MSDWETVLLGDVLERVSRPVSVEEDEEYTTVGVRWYGEGVFAKEPQRGARIAAKTLYAVKPHDIVYSRLFAWKGSLSVVADEHEGCVASGEFPTFRAKPSLLPAFFRIWSSRPTVWDTALLMSTGTTAGSRNRLKEEDFLLLEIELPPLNAQQRIVACVEAAEAAGGAYAAERDAAHALLVAAREEAMTRKETMRLGDAVARIEAGKSPRALDRAPEPGERGVLKVSAIRSGDFRGHEAKAVPDDVSFPEHALVRRGDVLIGRANTRELVGSVCRVEGDVDRLYLSDKTLRIVPDASRLDPAFLVHALASAVVREQIEGAATGTSESMRNISQRVILDLEIPVAEPVDEQKRLARNLDALARAVRDAQTLYEGSRRLRVALAEALVNGKLRVGDRSTLVRDPVPA